MRRLGVVPSDPIEEYLKGGYSQEWLRSYYNPCRFFDEVYLLSPLEKTRGESLGMKIIPTAAEEFKNRIKELDIDVVRAYGGNWACRLACDHKVREVPVVVSVHDKRPELLYDSIKHADIVLSVSPVVKELVLTKFKRPELVWDLPNRVDFEIMQPTTEKPPVPMSYKYKVLFVGRLSREKNLDTLIKAMKFLSQDYGLIIAGPGDKDPYQKMASELGVEQQCLFSGSIDQQKLASYYSFCDCMATPSRFEGFGMVFIEALACGAVVVTSDIRPMNGYISNGKNGLLVKDYENPQVLGLAIERACTDQNLRIQIKNNARKSVERFEKNKIDKLEAGYYEKILTTV